jgi:beta-glucosidase/6-phospho-beta-glucosidase/beta-galactosidase
MPSPEPSADAADHYHRWREDLDSLAGGGLSAYQTGWVEILRQAGPT